MNKLSIIQLSHLHLQRSERTILADISLTVNAGEQWIILGRNGSGKTTLLEMLTGYLFPTSGTVDVLGHRFGECDVREVRKRVGYMGQSMIEKLTLADPVWEITATGEYAFLRFYQDIPDKVKDKAMRLLERTGMAHAAMQPFGSSSQGERKKVLLAVRSCRSRPVPRFWTSHARDWTCTSGNGFWRKPRELSARNMTVRDCDASYGGDYADVYPCRFDSGRTLVGSRPQGGRFD